MDQPSIDGVNTWFVSKAAKEVGLKVALSGLGGDELFAGYPSFLDLPRWRRRFGPFAAVPGLGLLARALIGAAAPGFARVRPKALGFSNIQAAGLVPISCAVACSCRTSYLRSWIPRLRARVCAG